MACPFGPDEINKLKLFVGLCSKTPQILNMPELSFVKDFIEKMGGSVPIGEFKMPTGDSPKPPESPPTAKPNANTEPEPIIIDSDPDSDIEIDNSGCIEPEADEPQEMGDPTKEPTEEDIDKANEHRSNAASAYSEQNYTETVAQYTHAIVLNPLNALFHAKRGQAYLKLSKPNACIRDCDRALELNPDSAAAYKFRGRANRLLGNWEAAAKDLRQACRIDFDEEADEWLREVTPNATKLEQHKVHLERRRAEKLLNERREKIRRAQEANKTASTASAPPPPTSTESLNEFMDALKDPEIMAAFEDISQNPANITKYLGNPKLRNLIMQMKNSSGDGLNIQDLFANAMNKGGFPPTGSQDGDTTASKEKPKPADFSDFKDDGLD